jgi:hypothetical protein
MHHIQVMVNLHKTDWFYALYCFFPIISKRGLIS